MLKYLTIILSIYSSQALAIDVKTYVPKNAELYLPMVKDEVDKYFKEVPIKHYFGSLIEQESCIHLQAKKCWNPKSELRTKREIGIGFGQITKAFKEDGEVLVEEFISGREFTVGVFRSKGEVIVLPITEVSANADMPFFDFDLF